MAECEKYEPCNLWCDGPSRCSNCGRFGHSREQIGKGSKLINPIYFSRRWRVFCWAGWKLFGHTHG